MELKKLSRSEGDELGNAEVVLWCTVDELMELRLRDDTRALYMLDDLPIAGPSRAPRPVSGTAQRGSEDAGSGSGHAATGDQRSEPTAETERETTGRGRDRHRTACRRRRATLVAAAARRPAGFQKCSRRRRSDGRGPVPGARGHGERERERARPRAAGGRHTWIQRCLSGIMSTVHRRHNLWNLRL